MDTDTAKPAKLTKIQKRVLFFVGAFQSILRYGTWGKRRRNTYAMQFTMDLIRFDGGTCKYVLTDAGQRAFDAMYTACPVHGLKAPALDWERGPMRDETIAECEHCAALCQKVHGYVSASFGAPHKVREEARKAAPKRANIYVEYPRDQWATDNYRSKTRRLRVDQAHVLDAVARIHKSGKAKRITIQAPTEWREWGCGWTWDGWTPKS